MEAVLDKKTNIKRKINLKKIGIVFVSVFIIAVLIINVEYIVEVMPFNTVTEYNISADETRQYTSFKNYILVCDRNGIAAVDKTGKEKWKVSETLDVPIVAVSRNEIAAAASGGTEIFRIDKNGNYKSFTTENPIMNLKLNDNGILLAVTDKKMYNGGVTVFDKKGNELFNWWAGESRFIDASVTKNKILAISTLITENNSMETEVAYFNLNKSSEKYKSRKFDGLVNCIKWITDNRLVVIMENKAVVCDTGGKEKWTAEFGKNIINYYNIDNKNNLVFISGSGAYDKNMEVISFNKSGKTNGKFTYKSEIGSVKANSKCIMFIANNGITLVNKNGRRFRTSDKVGNPYDAVLFKKGNRVFADCGNTARLFYCGKAVHTGEKHGT